MTHTITLLTFDEVIEVEADETILEIAVEENIPYPFGCRSGNCGACKSRLVLGEAHMREHSSMALTADEAARGLVLARNTKQGIHVFSDLKSRIPVGGGQVLGINSIGGLFPRISVFKMSKKICHRLAVNDEETPGL